jgi:hypothetical protein
MTVDPVTMRIEGPSPALAVALDLAKRSLWLAPLAVFVSAAFWGVDGVLSTLYGLAIVVANFLLSAYMLAVSGRINAALMGGVALAGFAVRFALVVAAVVLVMNLDWVELVPLTLTLVVAHLALLFWEMRYVSSSLAFPGLVPSRQAPPNPYLPDSGADDSASPSSAPNLR